MAKRMTNNAHDPEAPNLVQLPEKTA